MLNLQMAGTFLVAYYRDAVLMGVICSWFCFCVCKKRECSSSACPTLEFSFPSVTIDILISLLCDLVVNSVAMLPVLS